MRHLEPQHQANSSTVPVFAPASQSSGLSEGVAEAQQSCSNSPVAEHDLQAWNNSDIVQPFEQLLSPTLEPPITAADEAASMSRSCSMDSQHMEAFFLDEPDMVDELLESASSLDDELLASGDASYGVEAHTNTNGLSRASSLDLMLHSFIA